MSTEALLTAKSEAPSQHVHIDPAADPVKETHPHPRVHTPVPEAFHEHTMATIHHHAHPKVDEADMEAEVAKKTQEIQSYRAEVNELEAKLFHDEEVLQIKEHELGVLEGKLIAKEEREVRIQEGGPPVRDVPQHGKQADKENVAPLQVVPSTYS